MKKLNSTKFEKLENAELEEINGAGCEGTCAMPLDDMGRSWAAATADMTAKAVKFLVSAP